MLGTAKLLISPSELCFLEFHGWFWAIDRDMTPSHRELVNPGPSTPAWKGMSPTAGCTDSADFSVFTSEACPCLAAQFKKTRLPSLFGGEGSRCTLTVIQNTGLVRSLRVAQAWV